MKIIMEDGTKNMVDNSFKKYLCRRPRHNPNGHYWFEKAGKTYERNGKPYIGSGQLENDVWLEGAGDYIAVTPFTGLKIEEVE